MPKSAPTHPNKGQSSIIPQIEKLLTEQTSVILQAVDEIDDLSCGRRNDEFGGHQKLLFERRGRSEDLNV